MPPRRPAGRATVGSKTGHATWRKRRRGLHEAFPDGRVGEGAPRPHFGPRLFGRPAAEQRPHPRRAHLWKRREGERVGDLRVGHAARRSRWPGSTLSCSACPTCGSSIGPSSPARSASVHATRRMRCSPRPVSLSFSSSDRSSRRARFVIRASRRTSAGRRRCGTPRASPRSGLSQHVPRRLARLARAAAGTHPSSGRLTMTRGRSGRGLDDTRRRSLRVLSLHRSPRSLPTPRAGFIAARGETGGTRHSIARSDALTPPSRAVGADRRSTVAENHRSTRTTARWRARPPRTSRGCSPYSATPTRRGGIGSGGRVMRPSGRRQRPRGVEHGDFERRGPVGSGGCRRRYGERASICLRRRAYHHMWWPPAAATSRQAAHRLTRAASARSGGSTRACGADGGSSFHAARANPPP